MVFSFGRNSFSWSRDRGPRGSHFTLVPEYQDLRRWRSLVSLRAAPKVYVLLGPIRREH